MASTDYSKVDKPIVIPPAPAPAPLPGQAPVGSRLISQHASQHYCSLPPQIAPGVVAAPEIPETNMSIHLGLPVSARIGEYMPIFMINDDGNGQTIYVSTDEFLRYADSCLAKHPVGIPMIPNPLQPKMNLYPWLKRAKLLGSLPERITYLPIQEVNREFTNNATNECIAAIKSWGASRTAMGNTPMPAIINELKVFVGIGNIFDLGYMYNLNVSDPPTAGVVLLKDKPSGSFLIRTSNFSNTQGNGHFTVFTITTNLPHVFMHRRYVSVNGIGVYDACNEATASILRTGDDFKVKAHFANSSPVYETVIDAIIGVAITNGINLSQMVYGDMPDVAVLEEKIVEHKKIQAAIAAKLAEEKAAAKLAEEKAAAKLAEDKAAAEKKAIAEKKKESHMHSLRPERPLLFQKDKNVHDTSDDWESVDGSTEDA